MEFEKTIYKSGDSLSFYLPKVLADFYEIKEGDKIILEDDEDKIIIRKK